MIVPSINMLRPSATSPNAKMRYRRTLLATWCAIAAVGLSALVQSACARPESVFPDPALRNPRIQFYTGQVTAERQPEISPVLPNIPGQPSGWFIAQWQKQQFMTADLLQRDDPRTLDPRLGIAPWSFTTPNGESSVRIYRDGDHVVFGLLQRDGVLVPNGGTDIFLSAKASLPNATFDRVIEYDLDAKLFEATAVYDTPTAFQTNAVLSIIRSSFIVQFRPPGGGNPIVAFLQIPLADSRNRLGRYAHCAIRGPRQNVVLIFSDPPTHSPDMWFRPDAGPPRHFHYVLNELLCGLVAQPFRCTGDGGETAWHFENDARDFKNWRLASMDIGIESGVANLRAGSSNRNRQGSISTGLEVGGVRVTRDDALPFRPGDCPGAARAR